MGEPAYPQLFGMDLSGWDGSQPPSDFQPVEAIVMVEGLNGDGDSCYITLTTDSMRRMTALGMVTEQQRALLDWAATERWGDQ
jgi:hypothetical protein